MKLNVLVSQKLVGLSFQPDSLFLSSYNSRFDIPSFQEDFNLISEYHQMPQKVATQTVDFCHCINLAGARWHRGK